jgi:hypothetical protein
MSTIVVIPSCRNIREEYLESIPKDIPILVVDDSGGKIPVDGYSRPVLVFDDYRQKDYCPSSLWDLIPHRNPSCKMFGFVYALKEGFDTVVCLDDDCDTRISPDYMEEFFTAKWLGEASCGWLNPCALLYTESNDIIQPCSWHSRGFPYELRNKQVASRIDLPETNQEIVFNQGLWSGFLDVCGIDKMAMKEQSPFQNWKRHPGNVLVAKENFIACSGMNIQFKTKVIPAYYQTKDYELSRGFRVRRHDDVWSTIFLKVVLDFLNFGLSYGGPSVNHVKGGDLHSEVVNEHYTNLIQPWFVKRVQEAEKHLRSITLESTCASTAYALAEQMLNYPGSEPEMYRGIINDVAVNSRKWAEETGKLVK